jgi:hypothetical protein
MEAGDIIGDAGADIIVADLQKLLAAHGLDR